MTSANELPRPISALEVAVIRTTLERSPASPESSKLRASLNHLRVVDRCSCGCDSVDFETGGQTPPCTPIGDAIAKTPAGGKIEVIVWGRPHAVTGLEIYDLGAGDHDLKLPTPDSIEAIPLTETSEIPKERPDA